MDWLKKLLNKGANSLPENEERLSRDLSLQFRKQINNSCFPRDLGGISLNGDKAILFENPFQPGIMTEVLGGLGITEYSTGKADFALSCKDCVTYTVDRKELVEAIDQNINLSELLSRKFETLLRATTEYDTIEPEESQTLLRATSLPLVRYGAINSVISITCSKVFEHMDEVNDITEMVQKALACAGQKVELTLNSRAGCSVSYKIDSDQLLAALKVNPDRVNYNDGHGRSF